jgi:hypothetical protein
VLSLRGCESSASVRIGFVTTKGALFSVPGQEDLQAVILELVLTHTWAADGLKDRPAKWLDLTEATGVLPCAR